MEGIHGVRNNDAIGFAFGQTLDGGADVAWQFILLLRRRRRGTIGYGWKWLAIKPLDDEFVDGRNVGFLLAAAGSLVRCFPVVTVGCMLNCFVGEAVRWRV